jgi:hypothetical protein
LGSVLAFVEAFRRLFEALASSAADCVAERVWLTVPQATERQRIGNQIDAAMIFARSDFRKGVVS